MEKNTRLERLSFALKSAGVLMFEYAPETDVLTLYENIAAEGERLAGYLAGLSDSRVLPEDREKVKGFCRGEIASPIELRMVTEAGKIITKIVEASWIGEEGTEERRLVGNIRDITEDKKREKYLEEQAQLEPLTGLYNHTAGRELISDYLRKKHPYESCGMMVADIDFFKQINDRYGHLAGDQILIELSRVLRQIFGENDIVMRAGGDEFVILLREISHSELVKKARLLVERVEQMEAGDGQHITCSVGVCFLPENVSGYTYEQMFENADWALYRAKEKGRNRYAFCDSLQRFQLFAQTNPEYGNIDERYLRNDIISTAFEIFERMNSFESALQLLMKVIGIRFSLDRITVIQTDIRRRGTNRQYQWLGPGVPAALEEPACFEKEDFLTLFRSYDEYGTTVLQYDDMGMYSEGARKLLMQGEAKTVVYAAMYCEGHYTGAISYVVCSRKRSWSEQNRSQLGELTKIISAHVAKNQAMNASHQGIVSVPEYDGLTGLLSFFRFREETERMIVGEGAENYMMVYSDFEDFKFFNQKYGYRAGDQLLREYSQFMIEKLEQVPEVYFTRVVADQFLIFLPYAGPEPEERLVNRLNGEFERLTNERYPYAKVRIRSGIYRIPNSCTSASAAIDAANYARKQVREGTEGGAVLYDETLERRRRLEMDIVYGLDEGLEQRQFQIYLQPRVSLDNLQVIGAEALVRWHRPDGTILYPDEFIPVYERNGRIRELDFCVFEQVAEYLAKNQRLGRRQIPISVNASILHTREEGEVKRYLEILRRWEVDPHLTEIELTETATVSDYKNAKRFFAALRASGIRTSLDDFGAGYSILNTVLDIPVDTLKLDRKFIQICEDSNRGIYFLKKIVAMLRGLDYRIVCEGVEKAEHAALLRQVGCQEAQGYWFAKPMPLEEFERLVYGTRR